jgi:3-oxoacyl-[acyl-carrier protein] reductase
MNLGLKNKTAIVTGSSTGMGYAVARNLALSGVKVLLVARRLNKLKNAAKSIQAEGGEVDYISADVSKSTMPKKIVNKCLKKWGSIDILVNNTGGPPPGNIMEQDEKNWNYAIQNNLLSAVRFTKLVLPIMKKNNWGRIITITSTIAKEPSPDMILSATSRAGLSAFSKAIAIEFAKYNISSNVISPGGIMTDRFINLVKIDAKNENKKYSKKLSEITKNIPARRIGKPDEIANAIVFLVSELGSYINGVDLSIDGAFTKGY